MTKLEVVIVAMWLVHHFWADWSIKEYRIAHNIVQEAIKQLRERGEKVTAFVVIAVAKQVGHLWLFDVLRILTFILNHLRREETRLSLISYPCSSFYYLRCSICI